MAKTVLITGASSGIGKAAAKQFAKRHWNVAATMRNPEKAEELVALQNVIVPRLDVTDDASIDAALAQTHEAFGDIDVIVNNAGYALGGAFEAASEEQIRRQFETNVFGLMKVTRKILPHFREKKEGTIINVASVGGRVAFPMFSLYHATKWAVEGFSESLQYELRPYNIRVKIIEPGAIRTDFYSRSMDTARDPSIQSYEKYFDAVNANSMQTAQRLGADPEVVARVILRAAVDRTFRLRYAAGGNAAPLMAARKLMPDIVFNGIIRWAAGKG